MTSHLTNDTDNPSEDEHCLQGPSKQFRYARKLYGGIGLGWEEKRRIYEFFYSPLIFIGP
jgi:hypothetical protein